MKLVLALLSLLLLASPVFWEWGRDVLLSPDYGHVLPLSLALLFIGAWRALRSAPASDHASKLWIWSLAGGAILEATGILAGELTLQRVGAVLLTHAAIDRFGGTRTRHLRAPVLAHVLLVPWPYVVYYGLTAKLQLASSTAAAWTLRHLGVPLAQQGNLIHLPGYDLEVVEACSGLRSLLTLTAMAAVVLVWRRGMTSLQSTGVLLLAVPLALAMNLVRLVGAGLSARLLGPSVAAGWMHDAEGIVAFFLGAAVLSTVAARAEARARRAVSTP